MRHTKEQWSVEYTMFGTSIKNCEDQLLVTSINDDVAQRIVACVNACEGITTEALEKGFVECAVRELADGAVQFYFDGVKMFEEDV
jgi:hypothetical protein